ncbi:type 1 glutamine amidotransferase domain-containing protein [Xanthomonas maliensis]|uniref:type 1 glutamine amidotransferase domain-containing protein n=1 Tax=Xanthomonas maliensis TaxID=1321368 RepID=UPI0003A47533|nr:type 1 glutamine amidotransferase domain-containing protein [Xanthomonas maliensis]KAB7771066.1 type 1 glutamine amidotransferase [Xanthomonas maliensis]
MSHAPSASILMMATNGYEDSELFDTRAALLGAGFQVTLAAPDTRPLKGVVWNAQAGASRASTQHITPDRTLQAVTIDEFDALVLPGGLSNPDTLRMEPAAIEIVRSFMQQDKVVAAICHAPWLLVEADRLHGRRVTGWYSIRRDLANAGAEVIDAPVVIDGKLITSRMPADIPAFADAIIQALH